MRSFLLLLLVVMLVSCGTYTPSSTNYDNPRPRSGSTRSSGIGNLPVNPDPNKCYVRAVTPDEYETYEEEFLTYTAAEADEYPHELKRITVTPEISRWETTTYEGCKSDDPNDCQVLCYRTYPAEYENVYVPVDSSLGNPFRKTIQFEELVNKGGLTSYVEIDCELTSYNILPLTFAAQSAALNSVSRLVVEDRLLSLLRELPDIRVQVNAHTDSRGSAAINQALSERRSKAVTDYLVSQGINRGQLVNRGFGESQLKNRCVDGVNCSEVEHAVNERVEFRVVSVDE